jgi:hypothetical protein
MQRPALGRASLLEAAQVEPFHHPPREEAEMIRA